MSERTTSLSGVLDRVVPPFDVVHEDWEEIIQLAGVRRDDHAPDTARYRMLRQKLTRRRIVVGAILAGLAAAVATTPALGVRGLLEDLFTRKNVPFRGELAPRGIRRTFSDLSVGRPASSAPEAIDSETRRVAVFFVGGTKHALWVAPTRHGGYCYSFSGGFTACREKRNELSVVHAPGQAPQSLRLAGQVHPELLGLSYYEREVNGERGVVAIQGDILSSDAYTLALRYADGGQTSLRFYYVSKPINAGFFLARVPAGHTTPDTRAAALELRAADGRLLARQPLIYESEAQRIRRARARAHLHQ